MTWGKLRDGKSLPTPKVLVSCDFLSAHEAALYKVFHARRVTYTCPFSSWKRHLNYNSLKGENSLSNYHYKDLEPNRDQLYSKNQTPDP